MSQENVETVRKMFEASESDLRAMVEWLDPDIEWWDRGDEPYATVHRGHDAVIAYLNELDDFNADFDVEPQEFIDAGEYVVVPLRLSGRGRVSGAPFEADEVHTYRLRDGAITEIREYRSREEALKAAGLRE
jgi:ketosteroid isomerase-like protein